MPPTARRLAIEEGLANAKAAYEGTFLGWPRPYTFVSVDDRLDGPRQRADRDRAFSRERRSENRTNYVWSVAKARWVMKDGGAIYTENQAWDIISVAICNTQSRSLPEIYAKMPQVISKLQGIDISEITVVLNVWDKIGIDQKDIRDVILETTAPNS